MPPLFMTHYSIYCDNLKWVPIVLAAFRYSSCSLLEEKLPLGPDYAFGQPVTQGYFSGERRPVISECKWREPCKASLCLLFSSFHCWVCSSMFQIRVPFPPLGCVYTGQFWNKPKNNCSLLTPTEWAVPKWTLFKITCCWTEFCLICYVLRN